MFTALPSVALEPQRYGDRPLLIVLENYVLDCIGELAADKRDDMLTEVRRVRAHLDNARWTHAWIEGQALMLEQAIADAFECVDGDGVNR